MSHSRLRKIPMGVRLAFAIAFIFMGLHLAGLRDWVSIISGTPVPNVPFEGAVFGGLSYVLSWFALLILAPILVIASLLYLLLQRWRGQPAAARTPRISPTNEADTPQ